MTSESYDEVYEASYIKDSNALKINEYNVYPELNPDKQDMRNNHKSDQAHDALEDGNLSKDGDMPLEVENKESRNDLGVKEIVNEPRNENYVDHGDYAYMDLEGENKHEKNAYHNEELNPDMSIDYYYNPYDRVTISPKHLDNAKCHIGSENKTSTESSYECLIETDTMIEKTRVQRTLSSMKEPLKQGSDDPKRGGKVGSDVKRVKEQK